MCLTSSQWVQIILSLAMFGVTAILAWATWKYMKMTKRMADSMEVQADIMKREFELKISPLINIIQRHSITQPEKGEYHYVIENLGAYAVILSGATIAIWHPENRGLNFPTIEKKYNVNIGPKANKEIIIELVFGEINKILSDNQAKKEVFMQPLFRIFDAEHKLKTFAGPRRTIW